jgi:sugar phosphate isomerase/epimerase
MHYPDGVYFTLPGTRLYLYERENELHIKALDAFRELCAEESDGKILYLLENTNGFQPFQRMGIDRLLTDPMFGLTWDVGHDYSAGNVDRPFLMERAGRIRHMHLHDAGRGAIISRRGTACWIWGTC